MAEISGPGGITDITTLNGLFKEVYGPDLRDVQPKDTKLVSKFPFSARKRHGKAYNVPVLLKREQGFTYAASGSGAFALGGNVPGKTENATVVGAEMVIQGALSYDAASRSRGGNRRAFMQASELLVMNMYESALRRLEIALFYGQRGLGTIAAIDGDELTITTAEWAPGIWSGMEGSKLIAVSAQDYAGSNTAVTVRSAGGTPMQVASVDLPGRKVTMGSGEVAAHAAQVGDHLFFLSEITDGSSYDGNVHENFLGLHGILKSTVNIFGISPSTYSLWDASSVDVGSDDLSFQAIQEATAKATAKGMNEDSYLIIPSLTWANVMTDQAALRRFAGTDGGRGAYEVGAESIAFWTQTGRVEVVPSIYCKEGYAYLICPKDWSRIGSSDVTFERPGMEGQFFRELSANAGYELRAWSDQALFCSAPGKSVILENIVNS